MVLTGLSVTTGAQPNRFVAFPGFTAYVSLDAFSFDFGDVFLPLTLFTVCHACRGCMRDLVYLFEYILSLFSVVCVI